LLSTLQMRLSDSCLCLYSKQCKPFSCSRTNAQQVADGRRCNSDKCPAWSTPATTDHLSETGPYTVCADRDFKHDSPSTLIDISNNTLPSLTVDLVHLVCFFSVFHSLISSSTLFSSTFKSLENRIQALSGIFEALYEPCLTHIQHCKQLHSLLAVKESIHQTYVPLESFICRDQSTHDRCEESDCLSN